MLIYHQNRWGKSVEKYEIDSTDRRLISYLQRDARMPYTEIAKRLGVSSGTIHQRMHKLIEAGVVVGSRLTVDYARLGFDVSTFLGVHLKNANDHRLVVEQLKAMPEVVEIHYTTGQYALLIKVVTQTIAKLHEFLVTKLQAIAQVKSTESFVCLDEMLRRERQLTEE